MNISNSNLAIMLFLLSQAPLSQAESVITDSNKDVICPIVDQLMYNAYDRTYALSSSGKIYNSANLNLAILSSQVFWDLYPEILNCQNAKTYEEQFARLGINKSNARLEKKQLQDMAKNIMQINQEMRPPGSVILSGSQSPEKDKLTISVPAEVYKQQIQQAPSQ